MLAGQSSSRMTKSQIAGLVGTKLEMRDKILAEFDHPDKTKNILRGSGFVTDSAFGPLPESLKLCLNSINGKEHMCKSKVTPPSNTTQNNTRGGYNSRPLTNQFFHTRGGARAQYVATQALNKTQSTTEEQNPTKSTNYGSERGQGSRGRGRGPRRNYNTK